MAQRNTNLPFGPLYGVGDSELVDKVGGLGDYNFGASATKVKSVLCQMGSFCATSVNTALGPISSHILKRIDVISAAPQTLNAHVGAKLEGFAGPH